MGHRVDYKQWRISLEQESRSTRPLKCQYCQRSYKYRQSLKMHIKEAHMKIEPHNGQKVGNRKSLERMKKIHTIRAILERGASKMNCTNRT